MSDLQRQKRVRGTIRTATTRLLNNIHQVGKEDASTDVLEEYLEQLLMRERAFMESDHEIEAETAMEDLENEVNSALEYLDGITSGKNQNKVHPKEKCGGQ